MSTAKHTATPWKVVHGKTGKIGDSPEEMTPWVGIGSDVLTGNGREADIARMGGVNGFQFGKNREPTTEIAANDEANAEFLVRAANCHDELADLVRKAYDRFTDADMVPANHALAVWLANAEKVLAKLDHEEVCRDLEDMAQKQQECS